MCVCVCVCVVCVCVAINSKILRRYINTLSDTIEYMNRQEQSREDPDETVRMHRLNLTFPIQMQ